MREVNKNKEELLGPATTDDEEDDEFGDLIDSISYFTEKPSDDNHLGERYGTERKNTRFQTTFSSKPPKEHTKLPHI